VLTQFRKSVGLCQTLFKYLRYAIGIFFCNIVLILIIGIFTQEITPLEIDQTVSQIKPKS